VCERVLGRDSLDTLTCAAALATTSANGAKEMRRVFETHVRVLGDDHPITVQSAHALAKLLVRSGARDEARALLARASRAAKSALGADHRGTRAIEADLACLAETAERGASKCANCGADTTRVCGRCRAARYCSRECQRACWRAHAPSCAP
jgi:hypothetical protein